MAKTFTVRVPDRVDFGKIEKKAEELGMTRSAFFVQAADFFADLDTDFMEALDVWSKQLGIPKKIFLQNLVLDWIAGMVASVEILGAKETQLAEFPVLGTELITGSKFYEHRKNQYITIFVQEKAFHNAAAGEKVRK